MSSSIVKIYGLPVSGTAFSVQLGLISAVSEAYDIIKIKKINSGDPIPPENYKKPDLALATSGGNIVAYVGLAADWDRNNLYSIVSNIKSDAFVNGWADFVPSWLFLPFEKSLFRPGYGFKNFFSHSFTEKSAKNGTEIWTGTISCKEKSHKIFTNKAINTTLIVPKNIEANDGVKIIIGNELTPEYLNGDTEKIAEVTLASASIPYLVKPAKIENGLYIDGGAMFASPISILSNEIIELKNPPKNKRIQLFYFSSSPITENHYTSMDFVSELVNLIQGISYLDIRSFLNILVSIGCPNIRTPEHYDNLNSEKLSNILSELESITHYGILLYPSISSFKGNDKVDFKSINYKYIWKTMSTVEKCFGAFVWKCP